MAAPTAVASGERAIRQLAKQVTAGNRKAEVRAIGAADHVHEEHVRHDVKKCLHHGSVVIAAITICTNTSNPSVMMAAGLVAKKAVEKGLDCSAVGEDIARSRIESGHAIIWTTPGLLPYLEKLQVSSSWDTAAPPASATPDRCRKKFPQSIDDKGSGGGVGAFAAIGTLKAGSTPKSAPTT